MSESNKIFPTDLSDADHILVFKRNHILMRGNSYTWSFSEIEQYSLAPHSPLLVSSETDSRYLAVHLDHDVQPPGDAEWVSLRQLLIDQRGSAFRIPGLGNQLLNWYHSHRFCGVCGKPTEPHPEERALVCTGCGQSWYPRISPCVIMLVSDGERLLLARHARYRLNLYTCLAGFVEPGETPEETVAREVKEEAGIEISNIRYVKSQSWPFPSQLMLGYFADYVSGELCPEPGEIDDLRWFHPNDIPRVPSASISVAGQLIKLHCEHYRNKLTQGGKNSSGAG